MLLKTKLTTAGSFAVIFSICLASYFVRGQVPRPVGSTSTNNYGPSLIDAEMGEIFALHQVGDTLLISTEKGLFRWNEKLKAKPLRHCVRVPPVLTAEQSAIHASLSQSLGTVFILSAVAGRFGDA